MPTTRQQICTALAAQLAGCEMNSLQMLVGLDGFIDSIIEVVDKRHSPDSYNRINTISEFAARTAAAAGESANFEFVVRRDKLGGNGPIFADCLALLGGRVAYIGNLGFPALHPLFAEMGRRAEIISIAEPAHTDAVEFDDGKLMLGKTTPLAQVNWENLLARVGLERLIDLFNRADGIGLVNWTMLPDMTNIWRHLLADVFPRLAQKARRRKMLFDLADPQKRTAEDLLAALRTLAEFQAFADVTLSMNLKESQQVAAVLKITTAGESLEQTAQAIRTSLNIHAVVIHPRQGAAAATVRETAAFDGPFVLQPAISTGAGDHFNAGFLMSRLLNLDLRSSLCVATAVSGYYVRNAVSPGLPQLTEFIANLPESQ